MEKPIRKDSPSRWARITNWLKTYGPDWATVIAVCFIVSIITIVMYVSLFTGNSTVITQPNTPEAQTAFSNNWTATSDAEVLHEDQIATLVKAMALQPNYSNSGWTIEHDGEGNRFEFQEIVCKTDKATLHVLRSHNGPSQVWLTATSQKDLISHINFYNSNGVDWELESPIDDSNVWVLSVFTCPPGLVNSYIELPTELKW